MDARRGLRDIRVASKKRREDKPSFGGASFHYV